MILLLKYIIRDDLMQHLYTVSQKILDPSYV